MSRTDTNSALMDDSGGTQVLRIWARQIETARQQTEEAIAGLSERFSAIIAHIDAALGSDSTKDSRQDSVSDIRRNEADLRGRRRSVGSHILLIFSANS